MNYGAWGEGRQGGEEGRRFGGLRVWGALWGCMGGGRDWGPRGAELGCCGAQGEQGWGVLGSEEEVWGPNGAGLGGLGIWGQIWVEGIEFGVFGDLDLGCLEALGEETWGIWGIVRSVVWVWGPNGAGLGCLGTWGQIWVEGIEFGVAQGPGFGVFGGFGGGNIGDLECCGV